MKDPFKGFTIATTGDFGRQRSADSIKRWIETNGGRYVTKVNEEVTHLICSSERWKTQSAMVQAAKRYPKIKIVTYDWLEDSLMGQTRKREGEYLIKKHVRADQKRKNAAKSEERSALKKEGTSKKKPSFADSSLALLKRHEEEYKAKKYASKPTVEDYSNYYKPPEEGANLVGETSKAEAKANDPTEDTDANDSINHSNPSTNSPSQPPNPPFTKSKSHPPDSYKPPEPLPKATRSTNTTLPDPANHHLYTDLTGYTYDTTLVRIQVANNTNERYILRLYQSNNIPYTYALHQRYVKFKAAAEERVLVPVGSEWEQAYRELKRLFLEYTSVEWEKRDVEMLGRERDRSKFLFVRKRVGGEPGRPVQGARNVAVHGAVCR